MISRLASYVAISLAACFIFAAGWFCLWSIGLHLVESPVLAVLLFPFGLRLGLLLQSPLPYWPPLLICEALLLHWLDREVGMPLWPLILAGSLLTLLPLLIARRQRVRDDWQQLLVLKQSKYSHSVCNTPICVHFLAKERWKRYAII